MVSAQPEKSGAMVSRGGTLPGLSPEKSAGGLDKDSIMKFYKKRTILPQEKLGAAADLKRTQKDMGFAQDDFRLDPEEVAFLRTLKEEHANRRRWRVWHKACLVIWIEMLFILIGGAIMMKWFNIAPTDAGGFQTGGGVVGAGLLISDTEKDQHALVHSGSGKSTLELRAAGSGTDASLMLSGERVPGLRNDRFALKASDPDHFKLEQASQTRMHITRLGSSFYPELAGGSDVDIGLDPGASGEVVVHGGVSIGADHLRTRSSHLTVQAANGSSLLLVTHGNGSVQMHSAQVSCTGAFAVGGGMAVQGEATLASSLQVGADATVGGAFRGSGLLEIGGEGTFKSHLTVSGRLDVNSDTQLRKHVEAKSLNVVDRLDVSGKAVFGNSLADELFIQSHISSRTLLFDEDHSTMLGSVGSLLLQFPDPKTTNEIISFPTETGTVLTTISPDSQLTSVATLVRGAIGQGFGGAYLAYASVSGILTTMSNVDLGDDVFDKVAINGRLTNDVMVFDKDSDGIALRIHFPDPTFYQGRDISFPDESGRVLTTSSKDSSLERVGALVNGSIVDGFGPAHVQSLISSDSSHLRGNTVLGTSESNSLYIHSHVTSPDMLFDANSNGAGLRIVYPDTEGKTINFPNETGQVLTSVSDFSTLRHVAGLLSGTLEPGFGAATVASMTVTGATTLQSDVTIGLTTEEKLDIKATITSQSLVFDKSMAQGSLTLRFPDPAGTETIDFPAETGTVLTDVSLRSSLTSVGTLTSGSLGNGFGDASVGRLEARADSFLRRSVELGTNQQDGLSIFGHIKTQQLVFNANSQGGRMVLSFPDPTTDKNIVVPDETGSMLTSSSLTSSLTSVGALIAGSIGGAFGSVKVNADIHSTDPNGMILGRGGLRIDGGAVLGDSFSDEINVQGTFNVKHNGIAKFVIDPTMGDTVIQGTLRVRGVITTESSFGTADLKVGTINEFEADGGVTIEGVLIRDGGILHTKIDSVTEMVPGKGVTIDGVVMKNGALITESATGTTAKGEVDMVRIINTGHDVDMDETITNIKFRQTYHDLTGANQHEPSDMVKLSAVTESDWNQRVSSRSSYFKISVLNAGSMQERLRLTANGGMMLNTDTIVVDGPTGYTRIHGDVTIGNMTGERRLLVASTDDNAKFDLKSETADAIFAVTAGVNGNAGATFTSGINTDVSVRLTDPSPGADGAGYALMLDGTTNRLKITGVTGPARTTYQQACAAANLNGDAAASAAACAVVGKTWNTSLPVCVYTPDDTNTLGVDEESCIVSDALASEVLASFKTIEQGTNLRGVTHTYTSPVGAMDITGELTVLHADVTGDLVAQTMSSLGDAQLGSTYNFSCVATDLTACASANNQPACNAAGAVPGRCTWASATCTATHLAACAESAEHEDCEQTVGGGGVCVYTIVNGTSNHAKITMGGSLAQGFLVIDADADQNNLLTLTFPHASAAHTIAFPEETGRVLTTTSKFSTLAAVGDVSVGNLVSVQESCVATDPAASTPVKNACAAADISSADVTVSRTSCLGAVTGACTYTPSSAFGAAGVTSLAVSQGSALNGGTSIGDDTDDPVAYHGFVTTDHLIYDTDNDGQCLMLLFDDPKTDYTFSGTDDINGDGVVDQFVVFNVIVRLVTYDVPQDLSWTLTEVTLPVAEACAATDPAATAQVRTSCTNANIAVADVTQSKANCEGVGGGGACTYTFAVAAATGPTVASAQGAPFTTYPSYIDPSQAPLGPYPGLSVTKNLLPNGKHYRFTIYDVNGDGIWAPGSVAVQTDGTLIGDANKATQTGGDGQYPFGAEPASGVPYEPWSVTFRAGAPEESCTATSAAAAASVKTACLSANIAPADDATSKTNCLAAGGGGVCTYKPLLSIPEAPVALTGPGAPNPAYTKDRVPETCVPSAQGATQAVRDTCAQSIVNLATTDVTQRKAVCEGAAACTYSAAVHAHCDPAKTNSVNFPTEDGTLVVKHREAIDSRHGTKPWYGSNATRMRTFLDGDVYLGTEFSDLIRFPGQIDHEITYTNSSVIMGATPLYFGGATYGTTQQGEICNALYAPQCSAVNLAGDTASSQTACISVLIPGSTSPACTYTPENAATGVMESCVATATAACQAAVLTPLSVGVSQTACEQAKLAADMSTECVYLAAGSTPFVSSHRLALGVPNLIADISLSFPNENGVLLSTSSDYSTLKQLGDLIYLTVDGNSTHKGDTTIGDNVGDKLMLVAPVHGASAMQFDGGVDLWPRAAHNLVSNNGATKTVASSYVGGPGNPLNPPGVGSTYPGHLATNGHTSGISHRWISGLHPELRPASTTALPYHWLAFDLTAAQQASSIEIWAAKQDATPGKICAFSVSYRPYTMGMQVENFASLVSGMKTRYAQVSQVADTQGVPPSSEWTNQFQCATGANVNGQFLTRCATGPNAGWNQALVVGPTSPDTSIGYSHVKRDFPETVTTMHMRLDIDMSTGCGPSDMHVELFEVQIFGIPVRPLTTLKVTQPTQDRDITLPDESGLILTDTSTQSSLTKVGALSVGSIASGFGAAHVASLRSTGATLLDGAVALGDAAADVLEFKGTVTGPTHAGVLHGLVAGTVQSFLTLEGVTADASELTLSVAEPTQDRHITFPDESGIVLTSVSTQSSLTGVGALSSGSTVSGFGPIVSSAVESQGLANLKGAVTLGTGATAQSPVPTEISFNGVVTSDLIFRHQAASVGSVTLDMGTTAVSTLSKTVVAPLCTSSCVGTACTCNLVDEDQPEMLQLVKTGTLVQGSIGGATGCRTVVINAANVEECFGQITTKDAGGIKTTNDAAEMKSAGPLIADSTIAFKIHSEAATATMTIPDKKTIFNIQQNAAYNGGVGVNDITVTFPTTAVAGQMLLVRNKEAGYQIDPGKASLFIYMGGGSGWVEMLKSG